MPRGSTRQVVGRVAARRKRKVGALKRVGRKRAPGLRKRVGAAIKRIGRRVRRGRARIGRI